MNVTKRADWDAAVAAAHEKFGTLDIVVNNAGTSYKNKPTLEVTEEEYARCFDVNVLGIFHSVAAAFPGFVKRKGGIMVNISSCGASRPRQGLVWYNASKGAVSNVWLLETNPRQSSLLTLDICRLLRVWLWNSDLTRSA
jgi:NADP-dependent 3-hydroxy acid dehydrogenase YdfG